MKPIFVTQAEAIALFSDPKQVNGNTIISIDTCSVPKLTGGKSNPMQGKVQKLNIGSNVMVFQNKTGSSYANKVRRHMEAEGINPDNFQLQPRVWGERIPNTPIIEHKGKYYLEVIFNKSGEVSYKLDGKAIKKEDIEGLKPSTSGEQGGQEKKVIIRSFSWDSIISFRLNKQSYIVAN